MLRAVSLCGLLVILLICFLASSNRSAIRWRLVGTGLAVQILFGIVFLYWEEGNAALRAFGHGVNDFLGLAMRGTQFVWGGLADGEQMTRLFGPASGFVFAVRVLPTLIFFSALMGVLYHLGVMQAVVRAMSAVMVRLMRTSGSESLSACANVFVGQTEAPLLVKPYLPRMTRSELHAIMVGGFATIAGGVFVLYTGFGADPGHLMVASVMAAPAGLVCSKMALPETEPSETMGRVVGTVGRTTSNVVEAAANGAIDGLHLALNVGAMLIAFLGLVAVIDWLLAGCSGAFFGAPAEDPLTLSQILAWAFSPVAAVMGASFDPREILTLGELLGTKLALTELVAYQRLGEIQATDAPLSPRTVMIASFALCGFANFASVAIQIGGLGALAPERRKDLAALGLRAMLIGSLATCMTACLAGVVARV